MATFLQELEDHVRGLNRDLLALEQPEPPGEAAERLRALFRTAHSLKGAARAVEIRPIEEAAHRMEGLLATVREGRGALPPGTIQRLLEAADALAEAGELLRAGKTLEGGALAAWLRAPAPSGGTPESAPGGQPEAAPGEPRPEGAVRPQVRVPIEKIDALLARTSDLRAARRSVEATRTRLLALGGAVERGGRGGGNGEPTPEFLRRIRKDLEGIAGALLREGRVLGTAIEGMEEGLLRFRMLPFSEACEGLPRLVRDLARTSGKEVDLLLEGGEVELDRSVLEALKDPLVHLVRNAVDHGAEPPDGRIRAGKSRRARVTVAASLRGNGAEISVADDGRGLDRDAIRAEARRRGLPDPGGAPAVDALVFLPGFTTAPSVTAVSGRGVGLDVVKCRMEALQATVLVDSEPGVGTRFRMTVPLTLATQRVLLLGAAGAVYALATSQVGRLARVGSADLRVVEGRETLALGDRPIPVVSLAEILGFEGAPVRSPGGKIPVAIVDVGHEQLALQVDELHSEQETVVHVLGPRLRGIRFISGAVLLPDARVALLLNAAELVRTASARAGGPRLAAALDPPSARGRKRLLLVEDSVTTRVLVKNILEASGYEVAEAADGEEAWRALQERGADLVVADIEMPRMDGFELTRNVRSSGRFRDLPVVLVTALESDEDRARGMEAGADAYLRKSAFDQRSLLETLARLL